MRTRWAREFAAPLLEKRKQVDAGNSTVAELQIFYLQKDAASWVKTSTESLDAADRENDTVLEQRRAFGRNGQHLDDWESLCLAR